MSRTTKSPNSQRGFALVEVMVSILIFSLGVIGLMGIQTRALQVSTESQDRNTAAMLANAVSSEMWVNKSTSLDSATLSAWQAQVSELLPNGEGAVSASSTADASITITWLSPTRKDTEPRSQFVTRVLITQ